MNRTDDFVRAAFATRGWNLEPLPDGQGHRAVFSGAERTWEVYLAEEPDQGIFRILVLGPLRVPEEHLLRVGEFVLRLNGMIPVGRLDLDFDQRSVRWVVSLDISAAPPVPDTLGVLVERGLLAVESLWQELVDLAEGSLRPRQAVNRLQARQLIAGDEGLELGAVTDDHVELLLEQGDVEAVVARYRAALGPEVTLSVLQADEGEELYRDEGTLANPSRS